MSFTGRPRNSRQRLAVSGVTLGVEVNMLLDITPGSSYYVDHTGAVFHEQDEGGGGNVAFYEIQNQGDEIDIDISGKISDFDRPTVVIQTAWGPTDFSFQDREGRMGVEPIISETSGYDTDNWIVDVTGTSGKFRFGNFDDTQAAFLPYIWAIDREV